VTNIVDHASDHVSTNVQNRVVAYWHNVDATLGEDVAKGLGLDIDSADFKKAVQLLDSRANRA
jgi:catalase